MVEPRSSFLGQNILNSEEIHPFFLLVSPEIFPEQCRPCPLSALCFLKKHLETDLPMINDFRRFILAFSDRIRKNDVFGEKLNNMEHRSLVNVN